MHKPKAFAVWGTSAALTLSVGVLAGWQTTAGAAPASSSTGTATAKATRTPSPNSNGNGAAGGNNGNGVGNGESGAAPAVKSLLVTRASKTLAGAPLATLDGVLAPGSAGPVTVNIQNPNNQRVKLTALKGEITGVGSKSPSVAPQACSPDWFLFDPYTVPADTYLAAGETKQLSLTVRLRNEPVNQDNCKGQTYTFKFSASANQA